MSARHLALACLLAIVAMCSYAIGKSQADTHYIGVPVCEGELKSWEDVIPDDSTIIVPKGTKQSTGKEEITA